jgi:hypothetical protein
VFQKAKQFLIAVILTTNVTAVNIVTTIPIFIMINMFPVITVVTIDYHGYRIWEVAFVSLPPHKFVPPLHCH